MPNTFAARLRALREAAGLTQAQLATRVGRSVGAVRHWEQGRREPSLASAEQIFRLSLIVYRSSFGFRAPSPPRGRRPRG